MNDHAADDPIRAACLAAKDEFPGSSWNDPDGDPIAALDALVAERDNAVAKGQSRLRCWLFGHDWKRREWHVLGTCDRCGKKEAGS